MSDLGGTHRTAPQLTRRALLRGGALVAAASPFAAACSSPPANGLTIGYFKFGPMFLARTRGEFERRMSRHGIGPILWKEFTGGMTLIEAMRAGAIDLGHGGDTPLAFGQASDSHMSYVAAQILPDHVSRLVVPRDSPIRDLRDVRGKKVMIPRGSSIHLAAVLALRAVGMTFADIEPVYLSGDGIAAFAGGSVDAYFASEPVISIIGERLPIRAIETDRAGLKQIHYYYASNKVIAERPAAVSKALDELKVEAIWSSQHLEDSMQALSAATGLPMRIQRNVFAHYGKGAFKVDPITPDIIANQQRVSDLLFEAGILKTKLDASRAAWTGWTPS